MKKIKFLSGFFALVAVALATTFTACEKEEVNIVVEPVNAKAEVSPVVLLVENGTISDVTAVATISYDKTLPIVGNPEIAATTVKVTAAYKGVSTSVVVNIPALTEGQFVTLTPTILLQNDINYVIELTKVNITQIVSEHLLSYYQDFENRGIEVHVDIEDRPIWVSGSENTIGRIVNNLTGNALKYATDGLKVKVYEDDNYAYIEYSNRTECMTEYDIKHIFDRFFMKDKSRNKSSSGLGLTISRLLADKMGGEVYAEYEEPWFIITVKLKKWDSD